MSGENLGWRKDNNGRPRRYCRACSRHYDKVGRKLATRRRERSLIPYAGSE